MYATFETFEPAKMNISQPEKKNIPTKPGKQAIPEFWQIPFIYNYGTEAEPNYQDFNLEFDEVRSPYGIGNKFEKDSISLYLDPSRYQNVIDVLEKVYRRACELLDSTIPIEWTGGKHDSLKTLVGKKHFNKNAPEGVFTHPTKDPKDKDPTSTKFNTFYFKLFSRGFGHKKQETVFMFGEDEDQQIDKSELMGMDIRYIPTVHFKGIFVSSGYITLQSELKSAIIADFDINTFEPKQVATFKRLKVDDPDLSMRVASKLAKIRSTTVAPPTLHSSESNDTSLNNIVPTISSVLKNREAIKNTMG